MSTFTPAPEMIQCAQEVFVRTAILQHIRPIVLTYETAILAELQFTVKPEYVDRGLKAEVILDPAQSCLMKDEDFAVYNQLCKEAAQKAGLRVENPDHCPLLHAEHELIRAEWALLEVMEPISKIPPDSVCCLGLDGRKKVLDLTLSLLAPYVDDKAAHLQLHELALKFGLPGTPAKAD